MGEFGAKVPTAVKRARKSVEASARNKSFKSRVRSAVRALRSSVNSGDTGSSVTGLGLVYKLLDKGVKKGIYVKNYAARRKSLLAKIVKG